MPSYHRCNECEHYDRYDQQIYGKCRRYPPKYMMQTNQYGDVSRQEEIIINVVVTEEDWCGEWSEKK